MSETRFLTVPIEDSLADVLIEEFTDASWRQCPSYARHAAAQIGASSHYAAIMDGKQLVALANIRLKKLPFTGTGIAFISHGPMAVKTSQIFSPRDYQHILQALADHYTDQHKLCLRIEPYLYADAVMDHVPLAMQRAGFTAQKMMVQTFMIDLAPTLETLRKNLNGKWRTDLSRGQRGDVQITRSQSAEDFRRFMPLLDDLAQKKGFTAPQDTSFFESVAQTSGRSDQIVIHLAWDGDTVIGGHIGSYTSACAVYLLGAVNDRGRDLRASYLLHWAVMGYAKSMGIACYDLGGVDEAENPAVYRFKKRMGGYLAERNASYEKMPGRPYEALIKIAERVYKKLKRRA